VAKLFQQLEVKDKQISAWDGVTQGLTKALATGQITPNIDHLLSPTRMKDNAASDDDDRRVVDASPIGTEEGSGHTQTNTGRTKRKTANAKRNARNEKEPNSDGQAPTSKPKWNAFPTFKKIFSRR
jgi:hypothetical protein